jgi:uncharacterized protein (DUF58 family)
MGSAAATGLLGLGLLLAARLLDVETLYPPAAGLVLLAAGCAAWVALAARGARLTRERLPRRVTEGDRVITEIHVELGTFPPGGRLVDAFAPDGVPVPRTHDGRVRIAARFGRRGLRTLAPPELRLRDPLGLARAAVPGTGGTDEVLVLPRVEPVLAPDEGAAGRTGLRAIGGEAAAVEVDGLRPYREGAPASRIHWPAVARGAGLIERRLRADADSRPLVVLDARAPRSEEDLDAAVRAAASIVHALARTGGGCALLLPGERRPLVVEGETGAWPAAHARLALVQAGGAAPTMPAGGVRAGAVVLVSARAVGAFPPGLSGAARGRRLVVVPGGLEGRRAVLSVAGCQGYAVRQTAGVAA